MHLSSAAARRLVLALGLGASGCHAPTGSPDESDAPGTRVAVYRTNFIVRSAGESHWLHLGDTIAVVLSLAPLTSGGVTDSLTGTIAYTGTPLWTPSPAPPGVFATNYFTHDEMQDRLIGMFFDQNVARGRLLLFVRPDPFAVTWIVSASDSGGAPVELARGVGITAP